MRRSGHVPAGGLHSRVVKHTTAPKTEPRARGQNPSAVAQLGAHVGDHVTNRGSTGYKGEQLVRGAGYNAPVGPTSLSNNGPKGEGRQVHSCGSQGQWGNPAPGNAPAKNHDILRDFGPDYRK
jgi:hypothetical protein